MIKLNNLFRPIFIFWYATEILFNTTLESFFGIPISQLNSIVNYIVLIFLIIQISFFQIYRKKEIIIITCISIPIIVAAAKSTNFSLLSAWMFIIASKKSDFDEIVDIAYKILCVMIPLVMICCFIGIIEDYTGVRNEIVRHSLGFSHPNQLGLRLFQFMACYLYRKKSMLKFYDFFVPIVIMIFTYLIPNSQTAYICMLILILLLFVYIIGEQYSQSILSIYGKALIVFAVLFNALSVSWSIINVRGNPILYQIDLWLSRRFSACYRVFQLYGISLLGQRVYIFEEERKVVGIIGKLYLDNGYMALLLRYGIIVYGVFSVSYIFAMLHMKKRNQYFLLIVLFVYALYGVMENGIYMVTHNIFLISFGNILYEKLINETDIKVEKRMKIVVRRR